MIWEVLTPMPGAMLAAVARLLLPVPTLETPGVEAETLVMPGVAALRLLLLLLVAGRPAVPPLAVVAGSQFGLAFCHLDHGSMASCLHDALEFHGRGFLEEHPSCLLVSVPFPPRGCSRTRMVDT